MTICDTIADAHYERREDMAMAFALALNKGFDLPRAVKFSVAVASLSCREYGGRRGVPEMEEALQVADGLEATALET